MSALCLQDKSRPRVVSGTEQGKAAGKGKGEKAGDFIERANDTPAGLAAGATPQRDASLWAQLERGISFLPHAWPLLLTTRCGTEAVNVSAVRRSWIGAGWRGMCRNIYPFRAWLPRPVAATSPCWPFCPSAARKGRMWGSGWEVRFLAIDEPRAGSSVYPYVTETDVRG